ncbi:laccase [Guyanagaster necrorhizus]|uniref:Laccase n=1 Tax=Guyanagaster necrorhizus TaxID=856835 RepID=A0A9P7VPY1_9AGAR|nr:laccase [Guyanagaster necrorhizus MCA 3950]KAG7443864.1 laccase [Guyanagaster necrorhizus MCA 3950]
MYIFLLGFLLSFHSARSLEVFGSSGDLHIVNKDIAPDGVTRSTVLAGGVFPGPLIYGNKGDQFSINVIDDLTNTTMGVSTSVHWHGISQHRTNYEDGTSFVTQCPISAGHSFKYEFRVPKQAGTFWYHSHIGVQYCDGLRGPLVVYDGPNGVNDPHRALYDVDDATTIITLADWYHDTATQIAETLLPPLANSTLINGMGRFFENPTSPLALVTVCPNKRYRFRVLAISCDPNFTFSIDGHNLTIIEADGVNTQPLTVNSIQILAAQRYSVILEANQLVDNYWIRAAPNDAGPQGFENGINSAILRYEGAPDTEPTTSIQSNVIPLLETDLHPLESPRAPGRPVPYGADVVLNFTLGFDGGLFSINGVQFIPPTVPVLLQILSGVQRAQDLLPNGSVFGLPLGKVIEINFFGDHALGDPHPFHLHGHTFYVVKSANSDVYNFVDPVRRDTTGVVQGGKTTIRFVTDNAGPWFLHCHIDFHLNAGLAVVLAEGIPDIRTTIDPVAAWDDLCPIYNSVFAEQH